MTRSHSPDEPAQPTAPPTADPELYRGVWFGTIGGTNQGQIRLALTPGPSELIAYGQLEDDQNGAAYLIGTAQCNENGVVLRLVAADPSLLERFGNVSVEAALSDGQLVGTWVTTVGTSGTFQAERLDGQAPPAPPSPAVPLTIAATEKRLRVPSCVVDAEALTRILAALRTGAEEAARTHHAKQAGPNPIPLERLNELYRVTMILRGAEGELVLSADDHALDRERIPRPLQSVEFEIGLSYRIELSGQQAPNRATVTLDFSRPPAFDISNPSGAPTPNNSQISVYGSEPIWVSGVFERIRAVLQQGSVKTGWIHGPHVYDVLVYFVGIPFALAVAVLAASRIPAPEGLLGLSFSLAVFLFAGLTALWSFRLSFSISRWLLPYVEYAPAPEPLHRKLRLVIATTIVGAVASLSAAALWALFT